jgi:hypothetical protein
MPARFVAEREYQRFEVDPDFRVGVHVVGRLLDAAIEGPSPDTEFDRLIARLDGAERLHPLTVRLSA